MLLNTGQPLPNELVDYPELSLYEQLVLELYIELESERPVGMDYTRIPQSSIRRLTTYYNFDQENAWLILQIIIKIDTAMLAEVRRSNG